MAKFLIPVLEPITINDYTIKDSCTFSENLGKLESNWFMASFDVDSLFTNIALNENIDICLLNLFHVSNVKSMVSTDKNLNTCWKCRPKNLYLSLVDIIIHSWMAWQWIPLWDLP